MHFHHGFIVASTFVCSLAVSSHDARRGTASFQEGIVEGARIPLLRREERRLEELTENVQAEDTEVDDDLSIIAQDKKTFGQDPGVAAKLLQELVQDETLKQPTMTGSSKATALNTISSLGEVLDRDEILRKTHQPLSGELAVEVGRDQSISSFTEFQVTSDATERTGSGSKFKIPSISQVPAVKVQSVEKTVTPLQAKEDPKMTGHSAQVKNDLLDPSWTSQDSSAVDMAVLAAVEKEATSIKEKIHSTSTNRKQKCQHHFWTFDVPCLFN